jgi:uncharacterized membrane protein YbaN (DUF454 family)
LVNEQNFTAYQKLRESAFSHHAECYTQPQNSICELPLTDLLSILKYQITGEDIFIKPLKKIYHDWQIGNFYQRIFIILGGFFLLLTLIGLALPIVPQVPFAVISAFCFSKGSVHIHQWIRENKLIGPGVKNWEDHRAIEPRMKIIASTSLIIGATICHLTLTGWWPYGMDLIFLASLIFTVTRNSK